MMHWTFSAWKTFRTCPRQYEHIYVLKDVKPTMDPLTADYGTNVHKAIEYNLKDGTPIPEQFQRFSPAVEAAKKWKGEQFIEYKMALGQDMLPCNYWDKNHFVRGAVDYLKVNGEVARLVDWKTGKNAKYAEPKQLELMTLMAFKHFPEVEKIKGGLVFLVPDLVVSREYDRKDEAAMWVDWMYDVKRIEIAIANNSFSPSPSGLCKKSCSILTCEHNGKN